MGSITYRVGFVRMGRALIKDRWLAPPKVKIGMGTVNEPQQGFLLSYSKTCTSYKINASAYNFYINVTTRESSVHYVKPLIVF